MVDSMAQTFTTVNTPVLHLSPSHTVTHQQPQISATTHTPAAMSVPRVLPTKDIVDMFWKRIAQLTIRTHDRNNKWIGGPEVRKWNQANTIVKCTK